MVRYFSGDIPTNSGLNYLFTFSLSAQPYLIPFYSFSYISNYNHKLFKMKKLLLVFVWVLSIPFTFGQNIIGEKVLTIKASTGDYSKPGNFLNLQTLTI